MTSADASLVIATLLTLAGSAGCAAALRFPKLGGYLFLLSNVLLLLSAATAFWNLEDR